MDKSKSAARTRSLSRVSTPQESKPWNIPVLGSQIDKPSGVNETSAKSPDELLREAKLESQRILAQARTEAERLLADAQVQGFEQGYESGLESGEKAAESLQEQQLSEFQATLAELHKSYDDQEHKYLEEMSYGLQELATIVCERMVENLDRNSLPREEIHQAIMSLAQQPELRIRIHPDATADWPHHLPIKLVKDESLAPGDFYIESDSGAIEGSWKNRWDRLLNTIRSSTSPDKEENHDS